MRNKACWKSETVVVFQECIKPPALHSPSPSSDRPPSHLSQVSYNDLCFPKTSNYGSMRKAGRCEVVKGMEERGQVRGEERGGVVVGRMEERAGVVGRMEERGGVVGRMEERGGVVGRLEERLCHLPPHRAPHLHSHL